MKKFIGLLAFVSVLSVAMIGCTPQAEGDTAPAPDSSKTSTPDATKTADAPK